MEIHEKSIKREARQLDPSLGFYALVFRPPRWRSPIIDYTMHRQRHRKVASPEETALLYDDIGAPASEDAERGAEAGRRTYRRRRDVGRRRLGGREGRGIRVRRDSFS